MLRGDEQCEQRGRQACTEQGANPGVLAKDDVPCAVAPGREPGDEEKKVVEVGRGEGRRRLKDYAPNGITSSATGRASPTSAWPRLSVGCQPTSASITRKPTT